jgi:tetratricopeptide (TPR) repeat protein
LRESNGYDVFIDYDGIAGGSFETVILDNIRARAHFLVLLTPTALERCSDPKDWMRREIEAALDSQRNIVPLMFAGFDFRTPTTASHLTGKLAALKEYNGLKVPEASFFASQMERLRDKYLNVPVDAVLHPASVSAQQVAKEQKDKATEAPPQPLPSPEEPRKEKKRDSPWWIVGGAIVLLVAMLTPLVIRPPSFRPQPSPSPTSRPAPPVAPLDASAMNSEGKRYLFGEGVAQDFAKAREWYQQAADIGNAEAMFYLGIIYQVGNQDQGVPQDYAKAREWYEKAADKGNANAMNSLAGLYYDGNGVPQDYAKAREWYEKAADKGDAEAMTNMGVIYENGRGVPQDYAKAREWYEKAVAGGQATAMTKLGVLYEKGRGVAKDYAKAREWYEKAADKREEIRTEKARQAELAKPAANKSNSPEDVEHLALMAKADAANAYRRGNFDEAIVLASKAIRYKPNDVNNYIWRGDAYDESSDYKRAIADYSEAIRLDPKNSEWLIRRGNAYLHRGDYYVDSTDYDRAIAEYSEAIRLDPKKNDPFVMRCFAFRKKHDWDSAIADCSSVIQLDSKNRIAFISRGHAYNAKGDYDHAIADYSKAIELDTRNSDAYQYRGSAYLSKNDYRRAIPDFSDAIRLNNKDGVAFCLRGKAKLKINDMSGNGDIESAKQLDVQNCE